MNEPSFTVVHDRSTANPTVLRVAGELDLDTTPQLLEVLDSVHLGADAGLVVDLTRLSYCDSTGITALITAHQRAEAAGASFALSGVTPDLMRVFHIVGLDQLFSFHPTVDQAVESQRT
ncbi:STAS domain-containing protein [Actinosynnema sp. NPDC050436]|uniref:STAS domain-containing protein n=1 Tax=Actinosynnema sp. NPDC050436 TaxID=3155659 RepID=UPI003404B269